MPWSLEKVLYQLWPSEHKIESRLIIGVKKAWIVDLFSVGSTRSLTWPLRSRAITTEILSAFFFLLLSPPRFLGLRCSRNGIEGFVTAQILAPIPPQATRAPPFYKALITTVRTLAMRASGFEQRVGLSINLPKELIGKVLFEINREVGQGLFNGVDVGSFHNLLQRGTGYTVVYTVSSEQTNRWCQHSPGYTAS